MVEVRNLRKTYGEVTAVADVTFEARPGEIFGLLGPNGAGKSTTIGCCCGVLQPSGGQISILGHDITTDGRKARAAIGLVPQEIALYEDLTARENLSYWGGVQGMSGALLRERVSQVLALVGLSDRAKDTVKKFSGGMKRRLNFACGVLHRPRVLFLDEPTVGVDPQSRVRILELIREAARDGAAVIYTSHYMEEAEALCDRLAVIDHGRIIASGTLSELRGLLSERDLLRLSGAFEEARVRAALAAEAGIEVLSVDASSLTLAVEDASRRLPALFALLAEAGAEVRGTVLTQPNLESLFIKLTGKELRE